MSLFGYSGKRVMRTPMSTKAFIFANNCNLILAMALVFFIFMNFFAFTCVVSGSMKPTIDVGETVFATKLFDEPNRGDIVSFSPYTKENHYLNSDPGNRNDVYIKRVVGLPGETVEIRNSTVYINDVPLKEDYLPADLIMSDFDKIVVPEGYFFLMGDNRNASDDSRVIGCIPAENIILKSLFHVDSLTSLRLKTQSY